MGKRKLIALALLFLVIIGLVLVDSSYFGALVQSCVNNVASRHSVTVASRDTRADFIGIKASGIDLFLRKLLVGFRIDTIHIKPCYSCLLSLRPSLSVAGAAYQGVFNGFWEPLSYDLDNVRFGVAFDRLKIGLHPNLLAMGIKSGQLNLVLSDFVLRAGVLKSGRLLLLLEELSKPQETLLKAALLGLPFDVQVPAFDALDLQVDLDIQSNRVRIKRLESKSSLHKLSGFGEISRNGDGKLMMIVASFRIDLRAAGVKSIAPWLAIASGGDPQSPSASYVIGVSGPFGRPVLKVRQSP